MRIAALTVTLLIAALHFYIAWFEIFAWETRGPEVFASFPDDLFAQTTTLAANQGLYNAFLAAGLLWVVVIQNRSWQQNVATFFLGCVFVAGVFGAATASFSILYVQTVPATIGLALWWLRGRA
ncbi:DUF1304 domain-containing protein [Pontivivens insulae]|uniref:DUF1304 domain-containing protein n=1 Tax=Pontivivens insulae TaxID=1639689 RepID=A0A2R8ADU1_9RHOB|nr:DUF1304 domain-containing protein [Pontivivens insulae]RED14149.1 putative membrane protein [Pontivivens insulae]SPF30225.1 hypothetical protein POI8812_02560 [Pontivivens insulae]